MYPDMTYLVVGKCAPGHPLRACVTDLNRLIQDRAPSSLLLVSGKGQPEIAGGTARAGCRIDRYDPAGSIVTVKSRYDVAVLYHVVEVMSRDQALGLIASLRDIHSSLLLVVLDDAAEAIEDQVGGGDLTAMGLRRHGSYGERDGGPLLETYRFSLRDYKPTPGWLSSRHWANPGRWNKFRW